ncbi:MAG TPA: transcription termination factor Rho [Trebonia sp.]|jgi:transcription termination factor Rho|nr:transcription termination factor Rho [Trebonia sp.]
MTATATELARPAQLPGRIPVRGIADIEDGHGYLRTAGYRRSPADIPLPAALVRQYGVRRGDTIEGAATQATATQATGTPAATGRRGKNGTAATLMDITSVSGLTPGAARKRPAFDELTPLYPSERLRLEDGDTSPTARIIDLLAPIGKGQRGLIVAPPKAGKTMILKTIAHAVATAHPEVHLMLVLVGERPEEVTDLRRTVRGEVISSTFDESPADHVRAAELAIERAKRLAEAGGDVVVLLDSLTRLGRAYNLAAPASSRTLTGGVAAAAVQPPRQFLGAARNLEEGGSVTIVSTALIDTGSQLDNVLFEEFKGTGNMELRLRRDLAERRLFPAIDPAPSGTRRDDLLMDPAEHAAVTSLRRALAALDPQHAVELLLDKTRQPTAQFLRQVQAAR